MRERRAKKSPFHVAYTRKTVCEVLSFACEGKNFANRLTRICVIRYGAKEITASLDPFPKPRDISGIVFSAATD